MSELQPDTKTGQEAKAAAKQLTKQEMQDTSIPPRVYIQIQSEEQRPLALSLRQKLKASKLTDIPNVRPRIIAPGVEKVVLNRNLEVSELRYFHDTELEEQIGRQLEKILNDAGLTDVKLKLVRGYESNPDIRPNHFELWLSADVR